MRLGRAIRRAAKVSLGAFAGALACAVLAVGGVDGAAMLSAHPTLPGTMIVVAIAALAVIAVIRRAQFAAPSARAQRVSFWLAAAMDLADIELALALTAGVYVVITVTGGLGSPAYPVLYAFVAFAATVMARPGAIAAIGAAAFLEAALCLRAGFTEHAVIAAGLHALFLAGAALAHVVLLRGLTASLSRSPRAPSRRRPDEQLRDSARDYSS